MTVFCHSEDWKYVPEPPYPISLLHMPCPKNYETSNFVIFDEGRVALRNIKVVSSML